MKFKFVGQNVWKAWKKKDGKGTEQLQFTVVPQLTTWGHRNAAWWKTQDCSLSLDSTLVYDSKLLWSF